MNNLANLYMAQGKYPEAKTNFEQALDIREKALGFSHPDVAVSLEGLAVLYGRSGQLDKSLAYYEKLQQSRQHFIEYVFSYASEAQKMRYVKEYPLLTHSHLWLLRTLEAPPPKKSASAAAPSTKENLQRSALEMVLKAKAVVIDAVSAEKQIASISQEDEIRNKLKKHREICGEISTLTLTGSEKLEAKIYRERLQTLYGEKDALEKELSRRCAPFKDDLAQRRFQMADVVQRIPEGSVLWEFIRCRPDDFRKAGNAEDKPRPSRYLAFTLDHAGKVQFIDLGDAEEIDRMIYAARERIYQDQENEVFHSDRVVQSERKLKTITSKLYNKLFAPLTARSGGAKDIFISPDGEISLLPFEIYTCPDGQYAIEKFKMSYLSSGRDLLRFKQKRKSSRWAMIMADPAFDLSGEAIAENSGIEREEFPALPSTAASVRGVSQCLDFLFPPLPESLREAGAIREALEKKGGLEIRLYSGDRAREEILKEMNPSPWILHLATHGFFCEDFNPGQEERYENPLIRAGLAFTGANHSGPGIGDQSLPGEDGILTAFEASGLNLNETELVILSACETGVGEVRHGEGVYGLRRAFQHAGAQTIVMSMWRVPEKQTCRMMVDFYKHWLAGEGKREALRQAALNILNSHREKYAGHPYFWGAFVLVGDPG